MGQTRQNRTYGVQIKFYGDETTLAALERIGSHLNTRSTSATLRRMIEIFDREQVYQEIEPDTLMFARIRPRSS